jgi:hypothetical protein
MAGGFAPWNKLKTTPDISGPNIPDEANRFFGRSIQKMAKVH